MSTCPLVHDEPAESTVGRLCRWHARQARRSLDGGADGIAALFHALATRLQPTGQGLGSIPTHTMDPGLNLNHRVVACRSDMRNVTTTWARVVIEERQVHAPADTIGHVCAFLSAHLGWSLRQPWGHQHALDLIGVWETGRSLLDPNPVRVFEVGQCPEDDCTGTLIAYLRPQDSLLPAEILCDSSPVEDGHLTHAWTADKWLTLGRKIRRLDA
jgi:hypothetical protein